MDPELKNLLTEALALAKENHHMLRAIRRNQVWTSVFHIAIWAIVILVPLYYLQPYLKLLPTTAELQSYVQLMQQQNTR